jgi:hypothetical protein
MFDALVEKARSRLSAARHLFSDVVHPSPAGHQLMTDALTAALEHAVKEEGWEGDGHEAGEDNGATNSKGQQEDVGGWGEGKFACYITKQAIEAKIVQSSGFVWEEEFTKSGRPKPGLIAHEPGASVTFSLQNPGGRLALGFLSSYAHMGAASVNISCDTGWTNQDIIDGNVEAEEDGSINKACD